MIRASQAVGSGAVAAHYDDLDSFYREVWGEHVHHGLWVTGRESAEEAVCALSRKVAEVARIGEGSRVCDVGCGYGATARLFERELGASVTGITVSRRQYEEALGLSGATPVFVHGDWMANDFSDGSFDAVIAIESTEHMEDKARFFSESFRVLREGGRLVVCAWLEGDASGFRKGLLERICGEGRMPGMGSAEDYCRWMTETGLGVERCEDVTRNVKRTWTLCATRFAGKVIRDPRYLRFLVDRGQPNRIFALTLFRILAAFGTGAMRYGVFAGVKRLKHENPYTYK